MLDKISHPEDVKKLNIKQLEELAADVRGRIISVVEKNGGHLASNLGAVELEIALDYVFDLAQDRLLFDVGHQCYTHKILSGRNAEFATLRTKEGTCGFPDNCESAFDCIKVGHAGTSLAVALGICGARDIKGENFKVIDIVGDGSFVNGENLEALASSSVKPKNLIVILNDNGMSISKNDNGLYKAISKACIKKPYRSAMTFFNRVLGDRWLGRTLKSFKSRLKRTLNVNSVIGEIGFKYVGVIDGHNIRELIDVFENAKQEAKATFIHIKTVKGKGYAPAEEQSEFFHGVGKNMAASENAFSRSVSPILERLYADNPEITAITAGMKDGTGLADFAKCHPEAFTDVGICEEYAVSLAAGMALSGLRPFVAIYSTFLQRAYDQILHDVCLNNLPVTFLVDRAGFVGGDGATHQGLFDIAFLRQLPNMRIYAPKNVAEFEKVIEYTLKTPNPTAIRYPSGADFNFENHCDFDEKWEKLSDGEIVILAVGGRMLNLALNVSAAVKSICVVNARSVKPLDCDFLLSVSKQRIITLEEGVTAGGFGSAVTEFYANRGIVANVKSLGVGDFFVAHGSISNQLAQCGLTVEDIIKIL